MLDSVMKLFKKGPPGPPKDAKPAKVVKITPNAKWLLENFKFYRSVGFFADLGKMNEKQYLEQIKKRVKPQAAATREFDGLEIALLDTKRVWHHDPVDMDRDTNFYIRAFEGWATVSRGILRPLKLNVTNNHATGEQTLIQFTQDSMLYSLYVSTGGEDWLDRSAFQQLNEIFAETGFRFELAANEGNTRYVIVVTPPEKAKLIRERNWRFVE